MSQTVAQRKERIHLQLCSEIIALKGGTMTDEAVGLIIMKWLVDARTELEIFKEAISESGGRT